MSAHVRSWGLQLFKGKPKEQDHLYSWYGLAKYRIGFLQTRKNEQNPKNWRKKNMIQEHEETLFEVWGWRCWLSQPMGLHELSHPPCLCLFFSSGDPLPFGSQNCCCIYNQGNRTSTPTIRNLLQSTGCGVWMWFTGQGHHDFRVVSFPTKTCPKRWHKTIKEQCRDRVAFTNVHSG